MASNRGDSLAVLVSRFESIEPGVERGFVKRTSTEFEDVMVGMRFLDALYPNPQPTNSRSCRLLYGPVHRCPIDSDMAMTSCNAVAPSPTS